MLLLLCVRAFGRGTLSGSLEAGGGLVFGRAHEFALEGSDVLSRLDWDEFWVPVISLSGQVSLAHFFFAASLESAVPVRSGVMEDYDFYAIGTTYSQTEAHLDSHFSLSGKLGYEWSVKNWRFSPSAGFTFQSRKWSAGKDVINYGQEMYLPFIDMEVTCRINGYFTIAAGGSFYPYVWVRSLDSHNLRKLQYYDSMDGGRGGTVRLSGMYYPRFASGKYAFKLTADYEAIRTNPGTATSRPMSLSPPDFAAAAGYYSKMDSNIWRVSLGIVFLFGRE